MREEVRSRVAILATSVLLAFAVGCTEPVLDDPPSDQGETEADPTAASGELDQQDLVAAIDALTAALTTIRAHLATAAEAERTATGRSAADAALSAMLDDGTGGTGATPLLPATETDRATAGEADDLLTATLTTARNSGGPLGRATVEVLRDPVAGDLGAWERDPAGVVATVEATIATPGTLQALEVAVLDLPGDATRALAWTLLASRATDRDELAAYAERGIAHLDIVLHALASLRSGS